MPQSSSDLIAVVDDDPSVGEAVGRLLRANGFAVATFGSGADFLASPEFLRTSLLVLDVCMPRLGGVELFRRLNAAGRAIPTLFITAHGSANDREAALAEGAIDYLNKPFTEAALLAAVRRVIP